MIAGRLVQLQTGPHAKLTEQEARHLAHQDIHVPRGTIFDRGHRPLAKDRQAPSLWADPRHLHHPEALAAQLADTLGVGQRVLENRFNRCDSEGRKLKFVWVKRWLTDEEMVTLEQQGVLDAPGLYVRREPRRFYPEGDLAAHVLGYANREGVGCDGVEAAYDRYLRSLPGRRVSRTDGRLDRTMLLSLTVAYEQPEGGHDVFLTIDAGLQYALERELDEALVRCEAPQAMGMLMDPTTGAILALACRPAYDPNDYADSEAEYLKNRSVIDVFEPGSSFKIVTAAAALEHGLVTPDTMIDCEGGSFNPYGHRIRDFHPKGVIPFSECFSESSNIAMIKVAAMLGPERLEAWIRRFGFGSRTSRDFCLESRGIFRPREQWSGLSMGALPIGQEIAVTMPQLARAFSVIANGGLLVEPYLVDRIVSRDDKQTYRRQRIAPDRILSQGTAETMKALCHQVVVHGTGTRANILEYRVGGKTGTAQMARPDGGGYYSDKYTTIFAGFAPLRNPKICAVIVVQEPAIRLHYGGYVCGPVFQKVVREALIKLNCPEDPVVDPAEEGADGAESHDADTVVARVELDFVEPPMEDVLESLDGLALVSAAPEALEGSPGLPDLTGLTKGEARRELASLGIRWDVQGVGRVVEQNPAPGTPLSDVELCRLTFGQKVGADEMS